MTGTPFNTGSIDIFGMVNTTSIGGNNYAMLFCDNETSYAMVDFTKNKTFDELYRIIFNWKLTAENLGYKIYKLQFDSDPIFESEQFVNALIELNIQCQYAPPGQHRSNGLVERMIQTITYMTRSMLFASQLPQKYWSYAMSYAVQIYNSTIKSRFKLNEEYKYHSPTELATGKKPLYDFPIFGCLIISRKPNANELPFLSNRGRRCAFLGFDSSHHSSYICLNLDTNDII
jgi:hypothetical protein